MFLLATNIGCGCTFKWHGTILICVVHSVKPTRRPLISLLFQLQTKALLKYCHRQTVWPAKESRTMAGKCNSFNGKCCGVGNLIICATIVFGKIKLAASNARCTEYHSHTHNCQLLYLDINFAGLLCKYMNGSFDHQQTSFKEANNKRKTPDSSNTLP